MKSKYKELAERFFANDTVLAKQVNLNEEEIEKFKHFEWYVLVDNGLKNINGGWSSITIYDENDDELFCEAGCGACDDTRKDKCLWGVKYNRVTKQFEEF